MPAQPVPKKRHAGGVFIIVLLGVIFFVLLTMLVLSAGGRKAEAPRETETLTVLPMRIRLRTEPNAKAPVVANAEAGEKLILLEDRGAWVRVQDSEGLSGWAERTYLERTAERERRLARYTAIRKLPPLRGISTHRAPLYAGPGIFYPLVGELPDETEVKVFTRDHDFYAVDHMGQVAYADIDAIDVTASGSTQLDVATTPTTTATPTPTETTASTATAPDTATTTTEPPPLPGPAPEPVPATSDRAGVYAAVPPGGTQPEEIDRVVPRYPPAARARGASGSVVIRGIVRRDGTIDNVEIIKDLPYGLGDAARRAVEQWRFRPATYRGEPIDVYYTVTVNFKLR